MLNVGETLGLSLLSSSWLPRWNEGCGQIFALTTEDSNLGTFAVSPVFKQEQEQTV